MTVDSCQAGTVAGAPNELEDGKPREELGAGVKYRCEEVGCRQKKMMGYKEFVIHMVLEHGGLEELMEDHQDERIVRILPRLRKI